jgi:hypothetical protein
LQKIPISNRNFERNCARLRPYVPFSTIFPHC